MYSTCEVSSILPSQSAPHRFEAGGDRGYAACCTRGSRKARNQSALAQTDPTTIIQLDELEVSTTKLSDSSLVRVGFEFDPSRCGVGVGQTLFSQSTAIYAVE